MADLNSLQAAQTIKIAGSDSSGTETTFVDSTALGEIKSADVLNGGAGTQAALTVGTTAVEVRVGASPLANRKNVTLFNNSSVTMYWGFSNTVTVSSGTPIFKNQQVEWNVGPSQSIYVIAGTASNNARITEA